MTSTCRPFCASKGLRPMKKAAPPIQSGWCEGVGVAGQPWVPALVAMGLRQLLQLCGQRRSVHRSPAMLC